MPGFDFKARAYYCILWMDYKCSFMFTHVGYMLYSAATVRFVKFIFVEVLPMPKYVRANGPLGLG